MVSSPSASHADADPSWSDRLKRLIALTHEATLIGVEGGVSAAARPLLRALQSTGQPVDVCLSAQELPSILENSWVVLLNAARDASWLNLARPVIPERGLRVLVWLRPGDRAVLRRDAPDFLDWMQQTVDLPELTPDYANQALRHVLLAGGCLAWMGPGLESLLSPSVPRLWAWGELRVNTNSSPWGTVVVRGLARAEEIRRLQLAREKRELPERVILQDPERVPPDALVVVATPLSWEEAAACLENAGKDLPGILAAELDLDPVAVALAAGETLPGPLVDDGTLTEGPACAFEPRALRSGSPSVQGPQSAWEAIFHAFDPFQTPDSQVREPLGIRHGPLLRRSFVLAGAPGSGKTTALQETRDTHAHDRFCVMVDARSEIPLDVPLETWMLRMLACVELLYRARSLVRWGSEERAFRSDMERAWAWPIRSDIGPLYRPEMRTWTDRLFSLAEEQLGRPVLVLIDGLDQRLPDATEVVSETGELLVEPGCAMVWTASCDQVLGLPSEKVLRLYDSSPANAAHTLGDLLERRLLRLEEAGYEAPAILRAPTTLDALARASGGRTRGFILLVRELALSAVTGGPDLSKVIEEYRQSLSRVLTQEDTDLLNALPQPPSAVFARLVRSGHVCVVEGPDGPVYLRHPILDPSA